ncbi:MAG: aminotransferase [Atopobiaceae bacterium]|nr:aminotransferase [Atopobiaceae bacterium]
MPSAYGNMTAGELDEAIASLESEAAELKARGLSLDMARGKPSPEQVALSLPILDVLTSSADLVDEGIDASNYGCPDGLPSARALGANLLGVDPSQVIAAGSSSLELMYSLVSKAFSTGVRGDAPWSEQGPVRFLCPAPGYDRHFAITQHFGIENVPVRMRGDGPDMDEVERLVEGDPSVKGIWCVPKYQNPTGVTFSDEVVRRFVSMRPAARDFRIFWDNAYCVHDLVEPGETVMNVFDALALADVTDRVYEFASTSKVTLPGSGLAWLAASPSDIADVKATLSLERVCPNKIVQLAHVRYLKDVAGITEHMAEQAKVLRPRFDLVERKLSEGLGGLGVATWTHPKGGYFVSFDGPAGSAKAIVALAAQLGVKLTPAGATWPGGVDPDDTNIRIAPTYPSLEDLSAALDVFVVCVRLVSARLARDARG